MVNLLICSPIFERTPLWQGMQTSSVTDGTIVTDEVQMDSCRFSFRFQKTISSSVCVKRQGVGKGRFGIHLGDCNFGGSNLWNEPILGILGWRSGMTRVYHRIQLKFDFHSQSFSNRLAKKWTRWKACSVFRNRFWAIANKLVDWLEQHIAGRLTKPNTFGYPTGYWMMCFFFVSDYTYIRYSMIQPLLLFVSTSTNVTCLWDTPSIVGEAPSKNGLPNNWLPNAKWNGWLNPYYPGFLTTLSSDSNTGSGDGGKLSSWLRPVMVTMITDIGWE